MIASKSFLIHTHLDPLNRQGIIAAAAAAPVRLLVIVAGKTAQFGLDGGNFLFALRHFLFGSIQLFDVVIICTINNTTHCLSLLCCTCTYSVHQLAWLLRLGFSLPPRGAATLRGMNVVEGTGRRRDFTKEKDSQVKRDSKIPASNREAKPEKAKRKRSASIGNGVKCGSWLHPKTNKPNTNDQPYTQSLQHI